ncbi:MAG: hypothetical protein ABIL49_06275 [candidate division WOR-3 bacterium]
MIYLLSFGFETKDSWFSKDKFKHFFTSYIIYSFSRENLNKEKAISITFSIGISKEIFDGFRKEKFSYKDLVWDILGICLGVMIYK